MECLSERKSMIQTFMLSVLASLWLFKFSGFTLLEKIYDQRMSQPMGNIGIGNGQITQFLKNNIYIYN